MSHYKSCLRNASLALAALLPLAAQAQDRPAPPPDTMDARVMACAACHGDKGAGLPNSYFPRIAGRPASYLYEQLRAFRDGERSYAPMNALIAYLPDEYLQRMADYYAKQNPPFPARTTPKVSAAVLARGQTLATKGDAARGIPACASCHGANFSGVEPGIPGLLGLGSTYLSSQLGEFRTGNRHGRQPDCMTTVATKLSNSDISAVSAWLATQPKPADAMPNPQTAVSLPLTCGSQAR